jgi:hypothetical protein
MQSTDTAPKKFGVKCKNGKCAGQFQAATVKAKQLRHENPQLKWTDAISLAYCELHGKETAHCRSVKANMSSGGSKTKNTKMKRTKKKCPKGHAVCSCGHNKK